MVKVISLAMWGNIATYCIGCMKNVIIAKHLFNDWEVWIYYNATVPSCVIGWLKQQSNVKLFKICDNKTAERFKEMGQQGMIWRYYPLSDESVEVLICRDIDSRLSYYEKEVLDEWLDDKGDSRNVLSLIDMYERKNRLVRGGTCAFRKEKGKEGVIDIEGEVKKVFGRNHEKLPFYSDEKLINEVVRKYFGGKAGVKMVFRGVKNKIIINKSCKLFTKYVGQVLDEFDKPIHKIHNRIWQNNRLKNADSNKIHALISKDDDLMKEFCESLIEKTD